MRYAMLYALYSILYTSQLAIRCLANFSLSDSVSVSHNYRISTDTQAAHIILAIESSYLTVGK